MAAESKAAPVIVGAKVDPTLKRELEALARENDRTVSAEMRIAIRRHVTGDQSIAGAVASAAAR